MANNNGTARGPQGLPSSISFWRNVGLVVCALFIAFLALYYGLGYIALLALALGAWSAYDAYRQWLANQPK